MKVLRKAPSNDAIGACDQIFSARFVLKYVHGIDEIDDDLRRVYVEQTVGLIMDGLSVRR